MIHLIRIYLLLLLCCSSSIGAVWYVRPLVYSTWSGSTPVPTAGIYGSQDGTSYANAWNGLTSIAWNSVSDGDDIYVCGSHIARYTNGVAPNLTSFALHGIKSGVRIRGDYPNDSGLIFGGAIDNSSTYTWTGPDANGVYASAVAGSGNPNWAITFQITNGTPYRLLLASNTTWVANNGECFFVSSSSNYIKTIDGSAPTSVDLALAGPWGWYIYLTNGLSNITFQNLKFVGGGYTLYLPDAATFYGITNVTFTNCVLVDGANGQGNSYFHVRAGDDYWNVLNCEIARSGEGIEANLEGYGRGVKGWNVIGNYIHDINTREFPTFADPHAIGVQAGTFWNIISNRIERTGSAIEFWAGGLSQSNNIYAYNFIKDAYVQTNGTGGGGIVITSPPKGFGNGVKIYGNIIMNVGLNPDDPNSDWEGAAIDIGPYDYTEILNNTIYNPRIGLQLRVTATNMQAKVENNIVANPSRNFINFGQIGTSPNLTINYNLFYTNSPLVDPFHNMGGVTHDANSIFSNPLFVVGSPSSSTDFKLSSSSPAISSGVFVGISRDFGGSLFRNPPSIGAWEGATNGPSIMKVTNLRVTNLFLQ